MADIAVSVVVMKEDTEFKKVRFGEAAAVGDVVYLDTTSSNKWRQAVSTAAASAGANGIGILCTTVEADGDFGIVAVSGTVGIDGATASTAYYVSSNSAGELAPEADLGTGDFVTFVGISGTNATTTYDDFVIKPNVTGIAHA